MEDKPKKWFASLWETSKRENVLRCLNKLTNAGVLPEHIQLLPKEMCNNHVQIFYYHTEEINL